MANHVEKSDGEITLSNKNSANYRIDTELDRGRNTNTIEKQKHIFLPLARFRATEHSIVIWLDFSIHNISEDAHSSIRKLQHIVDSVEIFDNVDECIDFLTDLKNEKVSMIIANDLTEWILLLIQDIRQLDSIYILNHNQTQSKKWVEECGKVKGLFIEIDPICNLLKHNIRKSEIDLTSISIIPDSSVIKFDELDQSFMYSQILKEIIIEIEHNEKSKEEFTSFCRGQYFNNNVQLNIVNTFERDYKIHSPIWWYTKESFIYATLNRALRNQDIEIILMMTFFLQDLHRQIEQLYLENDQKTKTIVYRGQGMINSEFEKIKNNRGGLLSFNNFLSTSVDQQVSFIFASSVQEDPDLIGILFEMEIDPTVSSVPFAVLDEISFYADAEKEILFSMHTVFRIDDIKQIEDRFWKINLTLTNDNDRQLTDLITCIRSDIGDQPGWVRLAGLMLKMGRFDKAIEIYNTLLQTIVNGNQTNFITSLPAVINNNAVAHVLSGDYSTAFDYAETTLKMMQQLLPSDHPLLATIYNNIGTVHRLSNDFSTALSYYGKAIEIAQNTSLINNTDLANSYQNMADVYRTLGHYSTALMYHEKTLEIEQTSLPLIHPDLATSYFKIGHLHKLLGNYTTALCFCEKARQIEEKSLPPYHSNLVSTYCVIGDIHHSMGQYSLALVYHKKAMEIEEKSLSSNHPDRAITFNNIGVTYQSLGDYSTALSYFEKSLEIGQTSLSSDHLSLVNTYNNIALALQSLKNYSTALSYYNKALELEQRFLSPTHPSLAITYSNIAGLYNEMKEYTTAISYYKKTIEIQGESLQSNHSDLAITYNDIGLAYQSIGDYSTALSYYGKTLAIQEIHLSSDHPHLAVTYHNLGDLYLLTEDYVTALSYYDKALEIKQKSLPSNHPTLAILYNNIAEIYRETEKYPTALTFYEKKLNAELESFSPDQLDIADTYKSIGLVHQSLEDYSTALSYYKKTLDIQEKSLSSNDSELANTYEHISELYVLLKNYSIALTYYEKALEILEKSLPSDDPSLITSLYNMSILLDKLSRYEEAIKYAGRAIHIARHVHESDHFEIEEIEEHLNNLRQKL